MAGNEQMIAKIKDAIKTGELTKEMIERRLTAAIDAELHKTDCSADMEFVRACQNLLWELNMHGEPYHSHREQSLAALRVKLSRKDTPHMKRKKYALGVAMATTFLVIGGFLLDAMLHRQWLEGAQSPDEQQYVISGQSIDPGLITEGQADNELRSGSFTTTDFEEVVDALGYEPLMPAWLPEGWNIRDYFVVATTTSTFMARYTHSQSVYLLRYNSTVYSDAQLAAMAFEQDKTGIELQANERTIYITENIDKTIAVWRDGITCYSLSGPVSGDDLIRIINSIQRSK